MARVLAICATLLCTPSAWAHEYLIGTLSIIHPHSRPTPPGATVAGGYMELFNGASVEERLLAVRSSIADVSFFDPDADEGAGARLDRAIDLPPGQSVFLEPSMLRIRFAGLETPLRIGDRFPATLVFEKAGSVTVEFWVEGIPGDIASPVAAAIEPVVSSERDAARITAQLRMRLGADTQITTIASSGSAAVAGWIADAEAGRAFLRREGHDWQLTLLSGASLVTSAGLRAQGISPIATAELLAKIRSAEAALTASTLARLDGFHGTLLVTAP